MSRYNIKARLAQLGKTQRDVIRALKEVGINTYETTLSSYITGDNTQPKSEVVLPAADKIISEWESQTKRGKSNART